MAARILNGNKIRDQIYKEMGYHISALLAGGTRPGLATVLAGENPASQMYVASKIAACEQLGIKSWNHTPPATSSTRDLLTLVESLNKNHEIDGILVQLPLPIQVDSKRILESVSPEKDVDGFHPMNLGRLVTGQPGLVACTPSGVMEILRRSEIRVDGANAVVVGRSDIVGKPMALLLLHANATVTICHSKTRDLPGAIRGADIVVAAMGRPGMISADWIKPGATVIDVGTTRVTDAALAEKLFANSPERLAKFREKGFTVVGDVHPDAAQVAGAITPVPGGVGPLTIAMLMSNTVKACEMRRDKSRFAREQAIAASADVSPIKQ
jgi:methylenetetrahydrofolate dehydrogenase (NADP+)/methenyltetrahydrofolate cyclohydrolase